MDSQEEVLTFMDLLDLDEEVVDKRLKGLMERSSFTNKHFQSVIYLLQYKQLVNIQDGIDCENDEEYNFVVKLISEINTGNIDSVCKIVSIVLTLNTSTILHKSEHLIQQILSNISLGDNSDNNYGSESEGTKTLLYFKLCESILDAVSRVGEKVSLLFLETPLENTLSTADDKLKMHFLTSTVPKLFEATAGYDILGRIWNYLKTSRQNNEETTLKTLCCLSEFYIPVPDSTGCVKYESEIITQYEFWDLLHHSLNSNDSSIRKLSIYLIKRSIDCIMSSIKKDILISSEIDTLFQWICKNEKNMKQYWDNYFILIESLEEKQGNIVLPSLQLFAHLQDIPTCWLDCAFKLALGHDNTQIRLQSIEYRLKIPINSDFQASVLLEAINDLNIYDNCKDYIKLKRDLTMCLENKQSLYHIVKAIPIIKWSPVPLYHLSDILSNLKEEISLTEVPNLSEVVIDILKIPCNNIAIRTAVNINIASFIANSCKGLTWQELIQIHSSFKFKKSEICLSPFKNFVKNLKLKPEEKDEFMIKVTSSHMNIQFVVLYLNGNHSDVAIFSKLVAEKLKKLNEAVGRQYSDKTEHLQDFIFIIKLFNETENESDILKQNINALISRDYKIILQYMFCLLSSDVNINIDEMRSLFEEFSKLSNDLNNPEVKDITSHLYKSAALILKDANTDTHIKVFSINILDNITNGPNMNANEMLKLNEFLSIIHNIKLKDTNNESSGRLRNVFFDKSCEIVYKYLNTEEVNLATKDIVAYVDDVIECGGYGCLKWILKIMNKLLPTIIDNEEINYNVPQFLNRMWKEIGELKSNSQYSICIEEFVNLITQDVILKNSLYNNIIIMFCSKILEYGSVKNTPLFYLVKKISEMDLTLEYGQIVYVLCELFLYSPVPRKDQRIVDNVVLEITSRFNCSKTSNIHFNFEIQYLLVSILVKISSPGTLEIITNNMLQKIDETFRNKQRYHGNSLPHRLLLRGLQNLLLIGFLSRNTFLNDGIGAWCIDMLQRLPHQPSIRICLEWCIGLHILMKNLHLKEATNWLKSKNVPITSQFMIITWVIKYRIEKRSSNKEEYEFVMDTLLAHTMGQLFNVRLYSQYLATKLYEMQPDIKYAYIIEVIEKTFVESSADKNFIKLKDDIFANEFNIVSHLTPSVLYYFLPKYFDVGSNENVDEAFVNKTLANINAMIIENATDEFKIEWTSYFRADDIFSKRLSKNKNSSSLPEDTELGTIQKKYIPWKNMADINVYHQGKKRENTGELILVASLIDKLPNLGGMARTSEVFGVKTYVIDSLRHLQDKQFQGLSVSAERWVNVEEVRPGLPLKQYLMRKKAEGYSVVAAEQTSTSCPLQTFKFPKKTLLILGHEKEGIPCDLLPAMDYCVEIPQQGFVRSLNVHITAAIFTWEYTRQNIL